MNRRPYYLILFICFLIIVLGFLFNIYVAHSFRIRIALSRFKEFIILFILVTETVNAAKVIRIINFILFPFIFLGIMFKVMHWPMAVQLIWFPAILIVLLLLMSNLKNQTDKMLTYLIIVIPVFYIMDILVFRKIHAMAYDAFYYSFIKMSEFGFTLMLGLFLAFKFYKSRTVIS